MKMMKKVAAILLLLTGVSNANNDECTSALRLYENEPVHGDNSFAAADFTDRNACGPNSHLEGVWYEIIGTGEEVTLNVCAENDRTLSVGVFTACNSESCVGFPPLKAASCKNNEYQSYQFFAARNRSYRVHIRANVINFVDSVLGAQFKVFYRTSSSPSLAPSPTKAPTNASPVRTMPPANMGGSLPGTPYQTSNFGKVATCMLSPPTSYLIETTEVAYEYTLPKDSLGAAAAAAEIEEALHQALSEKLLKCNYNEASYSIVQIAIGIRDRVSAKECQAGAGNPCSVVGGSMDMEVAFPSNGGRKLSDSLYHDMIQIFQDTLQSLGGKFEGFVETEDSTGSGGEEEDEEEAKEKEKDDDATYTPIIEEEPENKKSSLILGLGIAVAVIVLIMILLCLRRMCRGGESEKIREGAQPEQDEESTVPPDSPAREVDYDDFNDTRVGLFETVRLEGADHDFRSCGNPECKHCKPESKPIFVSTRESSEPVSTKRNFSPISETLAYNDGWATFDSSYFGKR